MGNTGVYVGNWQESDPRVGHESAVIWPILLPAGAEEPKQCLQQIGSLHRYTMQGRKNSDYHAHAESEQYYYILGGHGTILIDDERHAVSEGSVAYFAPGSRHQLINEDSEEWLEQLIISCPVERTESRSCVVNWRDVAPTAGVHGAAITWPLLQSVDDDEDAQYPRLLGMSYIARQALVRGKAADAHVHDDKEQVYYITEGFGTMITDDEVHQVAAGAAIYIPKDVTHQILNEEYDGWLSYLVIS